MTSAIFLAMLCLGMALPSPAPDPILDVEWQKWKIKYGKTYSLVGIFGTIQMEPRKFALGGYGHNRGHRNCLFLKYYMNSHEHSVVRISVPRHVTNDLLQCLEISLTFLHLLQQVFGQILLW